MKLHEGMKVRFTRADLHEAFPHSYPEPGTVGEITTMLTDTAFFVQWPEGSTSDRDEWNATADMVEVVE